MERFEVSDVEWEAEMQEDFESSGLLSTRGKRGIMSKVPKGIFSSRPELSSVYEYYKIWIIIINETI